MRTSPFSWKRVARASSSDRLFIDEKPATASRRRVLLSLFQYVKDKFDSTGDPEFVIDVEQIVAHRVLGECSVSGQFPCSASLTPRDLPPQFRAWPANSIP